MARGHLEAIERIGSPALARTNPMRMVDLQHLGDANDQAKPGRPRYMKSEMMRELTDETIIGIANRCTELPTPASRYEMWTVGGAMSDVGEMDAAVGMRKANYVGSFSASRAPGEDIRGAIDWTRDAWQVLRSSSTGGTYLNFDGEGADEDRVMSSLGGDGAAKRDRLAALKHRYDPGNRFRVNHNIQPQAEARA
jgi:hypothetical protein